MVHQNDRVAIVDQVLHHAGQAGDVGRVQPNRGFIQHIQNAGSAVAHRAGQLHTLALTGGKGSRGAVQRQVAQP